MKPRLVLGAVLVWCTPLWAETPETGLPELSAIAAGGMSLSPQADTPGQTRSPRPNPRASSPMPAMAWDGTDQADAWTRAVMQAIDGPGRPLTRVVPEDIAAWCPAYPQADTEGRAAFWAGLVSTLAFYESTHRETAVGGGGLWFGLVQISPATARGYGCAVGSGAALLDGPANLRCGVRIMGHTVPRDGVVSQGMAGVAADWGPFHSRSKREGMRHWLLRQEYCVPDTRPALRPVGVRLTSTQRPQMRPI